MPFSSKPSLLLILPALLAGCAAATPANQPAATPSPSPTASAAAAATDADRAAFLGEWAGGKYKCDIGDPLDDKLKIEAGSDGKSVKLTLFMTAVNPASATGSLSDAQTITIPAQDINGAQTSGTITLKGGKLVLDLKAGGLATCQGTDYQKS